jgi:hypothetical protein
MKLWHWVVLALAVVALAAFIPAARAGAPGVMPLVQQQVSRVITAFEGGTPTPAPRVIESCVRQSSASRCLPFTHIVGNAARRPGATRVEPSSAVAYVRGCSGQERPSPHPGTRDCDF